MRKAVEILRASVCAPLRAADLARLCGVPERTLNAQFQRFVGQSPMQYLRCLRLEATRAALVDARSTESVTVIAARHHFNHPGRFAKAYAEAYGELPSQALQRARATERAQPFEVGPCIVRIEQYRLATLTIVPPAAPRHDPGLRWIADGVAEAVAADLSRIRTLSVRLASAGTGSPQPRGDVCSHRLSGFLTLGGDRVRLILRLTDIGSGRSLWGANLECEADVFALQARAVEAARRHVVAAIRREDIDRASMVALCDQTTRDRALRALDLLLGSSADGARQAVDMLGTAMARDPDSGLVAALAAWAHGQLVMYNGAPVTEDDRLETAALLRRAAILDDGDPLALTARSAAHMALGELDASEGLVVRALRTEPTLGWAWSRAGWLCCYRGRYDRAIRNFRRALALEDRRARANVYVGMGTAAFGLGRYDHAARSLRQAMRLNPDLGWPNRSLSVSYLRMGERRLAVESVDSLRRFRPDLTVDEVLAAVPFQPDFLGRLGDGLDRLGLPDRR